MKIKEIYGLSRSRDKKGNVVKRNLNEWVNCIHTQVGSARDNMEVYIIEIYYGQETDELAQESGGGFQDV